MNFITNKYTNFPLSPQRGRTGETQSTQFNSALLDILDGNPISTTGKTKHFLFKNAHKKASKILQKCNSYFEQLFLDLNVSTDIPTAKRIIRNQIYFVFVIRNIGLRCKDGKWNSWILLNQLLKHNFWQILVIMYIGPQHKKGLTLKL